MPNIQAAITLVTQKQDVVSGLIVFLEAYLQNKARWVEIAKGRTEQGGVVTFSANVDDGACAYRIVERGDSQTRVIAMHCDIKFAPKTKTLMLDFGVAALLGESSYSFKAMMGRAGQARFDITAIPIGFAALKREDVSRVVTPERDDQLEFDDRVNIVVETRMAEFKTREAGFLTDLARLQSETREKTEALHVKTESLAILEGELKQVKTELETRKAELDGVTKSVTVRANIGDVVANIGGQITSANSSLQSKGGLYKVANVKIDMKGALADDGASIIMNDLWSADSGSVPTSSVQADLVVQTDRAETPLGTVPDLTDLTESAARRVLRSVGLRPRIAYRSLAAGKTGAGQCLHQMPKPGSALAHGEDVLVVIGKS